MKRKISLYFMIIILLTLGLAMVGFSFGITSYYYQGIVNTLKTRAEVVNPVWRYDFDFSKAKLAEYSDEIIKSYEFEGVELQLLSRDGELIQSSTGFYEKMQYSIDPSVLSMNTSYQIEKTKSDEKIMVLYTPLLYNGHAVGILRYATSLTKVDNLIRGLIGYGLFLSIIVAVIVFLISLHLGNTFVRPIRDIIAFTQRMAEGQYRNRIEKEYPNELGTLAKQLNYMGDEILKADRLKTDFISSVSHELRTPLTGIKGWIETMKNPEDLTEEEFQFGLSMIDHESERLIGLVENLLDFSRYQSERITLNLSSLSIDNIIHEIVFQLQKKADSKEVSIIVKTLPVNIIGDKDKLKQVLLNILDNAIKFSNKGDNIHIIQSMTKDFVEIQIRDNGIGMEHNNLAHIMESFYKIDSKSIGAGLGLAISKNIVELHKGLIQVESEYGVGTAVTITLPLR